jgi:MFS family permease
MTVAHLPAGYLADRIGRRPLMWASWIIGLVTTWIMAFAPNLQVFTAGLLVYGTTFFVMSPMNSYVTAARGKLSVGRALTLVSSAFNTGAIIGPWTGGLIAERMGIRTIYFVAGVLFIFSVAAILFIRPQPVEHVVDGHKTKGLPIDRRYLGFLGVVFLAVLATYLPRPLSSNFLQDERGLSYEQIGQLGSISSLGVVVLNLVLGHLDERAGFLLAQSAVGLFSLLLWRGANMGAFRIGYFLMGGYKTTRALATAQTRELVPASRIGLAYGLTETIGSTAAILAPILAGYLYAIRPEWMYILSLLLVLLSITLGGIYLLATNGRYRSPVTSDN